MQITVNSQALASELRLVNKVVPPKPAIAILSHVLITAEDDVVKFYATDIEIGLLTECPAKVADKGMIVLPCAKLLAMVEQFPDADVSISTEANKVIIRCEAFTSRIQSLSALDFPQMPSVDGTAFPLDGAAFIKVIGRTRYAISGVSSKYVLQGALLTMTEAGAALVATDSKRLALATMERESDTNYEVIFPAKTLDLIVLQGEQGPLEVSVGERNIFIASPGRLIVSRMVEGKFPGYERIIPRNNPHLVTIQKSLLSSALKRNQLVSDEGVINITVKPGVLDIVAANVDIGTADESVKVGYEGPPITITVRGDYILDFLDVAESSTVTMALKDGKNPALFSDGDDHIAVVMLMRK